MQPAAPDAAPAAAPDPMAWSEVFLRERPRLLAFARRRVCASGAEDVVAETFARALEASDRYRPERGPIEGWLFGVARNVVHEHVRRANNAIVTNLDDRCSPVHNLATDPLSGRVEAMDLAAAFARLSADDRRLLALRILQGRSSAEVGRMTGRRAGAVRMAQARALDRLRAEIAEPETVRADSA